MTIRSLRSPHRGQGRDHQPDRRRDPRGARIDGPDAHGVWAPHRLAMADTSSVRDGASSPASGSAAQDPARDSASAGTVSRPARGARARGLRVGTHVSVVARIDKRQTIVQAVVRGTVGGFMSEPDLWVCAFTDPIDGVLARIFSLADEGRTWVRGWGKVADALRTAAALTA